MAFFRNSVVAVVIALALCSCGVRRQSIRDAATIQDGSGVMVARIVLIQQNASAGNPPVELSAIKQSSLTVAALVWEAQPGETFAVMTLPAGKYTWRGLYVGRKFSEFRNLLPFEVEPGQVNYVGDIVIAIDWSNPSRYGMRVIANQAASESYMRTAYPRLIAHHPLVASLTVDER